VDIKEYNISSLRSLLSVVSQEPILFDCSIRENVTYGLQGDVPMADVIAACRTANIHEFIHDLPQVNTCFLVRVVDEVMTSV
jgi:ABC-type multidrug transport system fused ATPase/permease subunit